MMDNLGGNAWDDSELLEMFESAINSHTRKGSKRNRSITEIDDNKNTLENQEINRKEPTDRYESPAVFAAPPRSKYIKKIPGFKSKAAPTNPAVLDQSVDDSSGNVNIHYNNSENRTEFYSNANADPAWTSTAFAAEPHQNFDAFSEKASIRPSAAMIENALADMLNAWYQSGYMTGRYHTLLELQQIKNIETTEDDSKK